MSDKILLRGVNIYQFLLSEHLPVPYRTMSGRVCRRAIDVPAVLWAHWSVAMIIRIYQSHIGQ
jgi:hypothetical protein